MKRFIFVSVLFLVSAILFAQSGGVLETDVEVGDEFSNLSSIMLWKSFDLGDSEFETSMLLESETSDERLTASPGIALLFMDRTARLGTDFYLDHYNDDDTVTSQSFWLGLYGDGDHLSGRVTGEFWTDFTSVYEVITAASGSVSLTEDDLSVVIGQGIEWSYLDDYDDEYVRDRIRAETSAELGYESSLSPFIRGTMQHEWFQSEHELNEWTQKMTYSNSLLLEAGLMPEDEDFTITAYTEIPLFSELEDGERIFGLNVKVEMF
ncbi:MAG: hypothetical protein ACLFTR_04215 [Candidatus Woesearchaeota archaeon]